MRYQFTKMQSLGNDFIVFDGVSNANVANLVITAELVRRLTDRHFGIGCDQLLLVESALVSDASEPARDAAEVDAAESDAEFACRIFNHDGSEVEQCGNGLRCLARFLYDGGLSKSKVIRVRLRESVVTLTINPDASVTVEMGTPEFAPARIPFLAERAAATYPLEVDGEEVEISAVAIGNPHALWRVPNIAGAPLATHGPLIENHPRFPARVNAGFMQIVARDHLLLRVYERGVGETLGCGSGACAAVAVGVNLGLLDPRVKVSLPGGDAEVSWRGPGHPIFLSGSAHAVFSGEIDL